MHEYRWSAYIAFKREFSKQNPPPPPPPPQKKKKKKDEYKIK